MKSIRITNPVDSSYFEVLQDKIGDLEGWEYPSVKNVVDDVFGVVGAKYITSSFGRRRFSFISYLRDQCDDDRRSMIKALRQTGSEKTLTFTTLPDTILYPSGLALQASVEVLSIKNPYKHIAKPFLIELIAADFRFFSQALNTDNVAAAGTEVIANAGNADASPVFTITGPGNSIVVHHGGTAEEFGIGNITAGQVVEVDVLNRTVKLDGVIDFSFFTGDFFHLLPGNNSITFTVPSGSTAATDLQIDWRDAYGGV